MICINKNKLPVILTGMSKLDKWCALADQTFLEKKQGVGTDRNLHKILPKRNTIIRSLGMYLNTKKIDNEGPRYWKYFLPTWSTPGMDTKYWHLSIITDSVGYRTISNNRWKDSQYPWYSMKLFSSLSFFFSILLLSFVFLLFIWFHVNERRCGEYVYKTIVQQHK